MWPFRRKPKEEKKNRIVKKVVVGLIIGSAIGSIIGKKVMEKNEKMKDEEWKMKNCRDVPMERP